MTVSYSGLWKMLQENGLRKQNLVDDVGLSPVKKAGWLMIKSLTGSVSI